MVKDWDALDMTKPYTAIGLLSDAIYLENADPRYHGLVQSQIKILLESPEDYRW